MFPHCNIDKYKLARLLSSAAVFWGSVIFNVFTRRWLVVVYSNFGTAYQSHLQGSSSSTLRKNPEESEDLKYKFL
jgi:hypothetical protein